MLFEVKSNLEMDLPNYFSSSENPVPRSRRYFRRCSVTEENLRLALFKESPKTDSERRMATQVTDDEDAMLPDEIDPAKTGPTGRCVGRKRSLVWDPTEDISEAALDWSHSPQNPKRLQELRIVTPNTMCTKRI